MISRLLVLLTVASTAAAIPCRPNEDPWIVAIQTRPVQCCARHDTGGTGTYDVDLTILRCPLPSVRRILVDTNLDMVTKVPFVTSASACRSRTQPVRRCCTITAVSITGPDTPRDAGGFFIDVKNPITSFRGALRCTHHHVRAIEGQVERIR